MPRLRHRPDIDGLRAVAVLPVLLFHGGVPGFAGGFVGVDVFFVISGYLISSIILEDLYAGRFSLLMFYERRVRRIIPALFAMLLVAMALGTLLLLPEDLMNLGQSAAAAALSLSNLLFWHETGYFDTAAEYKPLLHTWSLGVEEQFYILFPLILSLLFRGSRRVALAMLGLAALLSLALAELGPRAAAFYLAPSRAWELLLGAFLALGVVPAPARKGMRDALSLAGLGLIAWSVVRLSPDTWFPGLAALPPCLGAALVIYAGASGTSLGGRLLSFAPLVFVGLISYSLYLWHWPLLVFARSYAARDLTTLEAAAVLALSGVVAALSWRWIERPFRGRRSVLSRPRLFATTGAVAAATVAAGLALHLSHGLPGRLPTSAMRLADGVRERAAGAGCASPSLQAIQRADLCHIGAEAGTRVTFLLWGDSHAGMLRTALSSVAARTGRTGLFAGSPGCPPLLDLDVLTPGGADREPCREINGAVMRMALRQAEIDTVVLAAHWSLYATGVRLSQPDGRRVRLLDARAAGDVSPANEAAFQRGLRRTVETLAAAGKRVVLVGPVPEVEASVPWTLGLAAWRGQEVDIRPSRSEFEARNHATLSTMLRLSGLGPVTVLHPESVLCDASRCRVEEGGRTLYSDDNHLSVSGATSLSRLFEGVL